jgi:hypothetical protein
MSDRLTTAVACTCTITKHERMENRACPVHVSKSQQKRIAALTAPVDISPETVEAMAQWCEGANGKMPGTLRPSAMLRELSLALTARDDALASIRVFAQDCIENSHDRDHIGNLYGIRDLCDSKGETK